MLEKAQNLIDNFEDQKIMKIEQTDEQKSEEVTRTYESVQQFAKSSVMVYGCQASINTVEQQIGTVILNYSALSLSRIIRKMPP